MSRDDPTGTKSRPLLECCSPRGSGSPAWPRHRLCPGRSSASSSIAGVAAHAGGAEAAERARPAVGCSFAPGAVTSAARIASLHHASSGHAGRGWCFGSSRVTHPAVCRVGAWALALPALRLARSLERSAIPLPMSMPRSVAEMPEIGEEDRRIDDSRGTSFGADAERCSTRSRLRTFRTRSLTSRVGGS